MTAYVSITTPAGYHKSVRFDGQRADIDATVYAEIIRWRHPDVIVRTYVRRTRPALCGQDPGPVPVKEVSP